MGLPGPVPPLEELAAGLRARLGEGPVLLVGHSQSCQVVAAAAGDPRVAGLVLLGPTTDPRLRSAVGLARRWVATAVGERWPHVLLAPRSGCAPGRGRCGGCGPWPRPTGSTPG